MDPVAVVSIFVGGVMAFMGYRMFLDVLRLWGFLIVGTIGAIIGSLLFPGASPLFQFGVPLTSDSVRLTLPLAIGFLAGGVVGALMAHPLKGVIAFLTGFIAAYEASIFLYHMITGSSSLLIALGVGAAVGLLAIRWEEVVLIVSTAFLGSAAAIYGITTVLPALNNLIATIIFFLAGFFGAAAQYRDAHQG